MLAGRSVVFDLVCKGIVVSFDGLKFLSNRGVLSMSNYDIIFGMGWFYLIEYSLIALPKSYHSSYEGRITNRGQHET